jgi:hypothetical protein
MAFILIGCEESQEVTIAFRKLGHQAFSCDLQDCSGNHPEWHFKIDLFKVIQGGYLVNQSSELIYIKKWDLGIFHPPCTYLTVSANKWLKDQPLRLSGALVGKQRRDAQKLAIDFFMKIVNCNIEKYVIENPIGIMSTKYRKPNQVIQPWMYGHGETKATCLWLKKIPRLNGFNVVDGREQRLHKLPNTPERSKIRSKTFTGIAEQMAIQWSIYL